MTIQGGCRCGATRYTLSMEGPPPSYACHCLDCQTWSGSAFGLHALLPADAVAVTGPTLTFPQEGHGGPASEHIVCGTCHTRILNTNAAVPGMVVLRAGTLDDSDGVMPVAHIWTTRKQPWLELPREVPAFAESPTPEQFGAALSRAVNAGPVRHDLI